MILITGATGMLGSEICSLLRQQNKEVRAFTRSSSNENKLQNLKNQGVHIFEGDLRKPDDLKKALNGIEAVITTVSSMPFAYVPGKNDIETVDKNGVKNLVDIAKTVGVKHFVYTSFSKNIDADFPLRNAKREVEKHLKNSGINFTILRPGYFMEVWFSEAVGFDAVNGKVQICGEGAQPVSYISYKDVAKYAVKSLENSNAQNSVLEIGGPESVSQLDVVKLFESKHNQKFDVNHVPEEALKQQIKTAQDQMQKSFFGLMYCLAKGDKIPMEENNRQFGIELTSVKDFISG